MFPELQEDGHSELTGMPVLCRLRNSGVNHACNPAILFGNKHDGILSVSLGQPLPFLPQGRNRRSMADGITTVRPECCQILDQLRCILNGGLSDFHRSTLEVELVASVSVAGSQGFLEGQLDDGVEVVR